MFVQRYVICDDRHSIRERPLDDDWVVIPCGGGVSVTMSVSVVTRFQLDGQIINSSIRNGHQFWMPIRTQFAGRLSEGKQNILFYFPKQKTAPVFRGWVWRAKCPSELFRIIDQIHKVTFTMKPQSVIHDERKLIISARYSNSSTVIFVDNELCPCLLMRFTNISDSLLRLLHAIHSLLIMLLYI